MGKKRRKLYGVWFECLRPGVWRSECGWYLLQRISGTYWEGFDLETGKRTFGNGIGGAAWHALGMTLDKWKSQKSA